MYFVVYSHVSSKAREGLLNAAVHFISFSTSSAESEEGCRGMRITVM